MGSGCGAGVGAGAGAGVAATGAGAGAGVCTGAGLGAAMAVSALPVTASGEQSPQAVRVSAAKRVMSRRLMLLKPRGVEQSDKSHAVR